MNIRALSFTLTSAVGLAVGCGLLSAGPIQPAAGPVGPTMKTLTELEPRVAVNATNTPGDNDATPSLYRITAPGSYYLTGNISCPSGKTAIEIDSSNVTLDLNGFTILGVPGTVNGVHAAAVFANVVVKNGMIRGFTGSGVDFYTPGEVTGGTIEDLTLTGNGQYGARLGSESAARRCTALNNLGHGVSITGSGLIASCLAKGNHGVGLSVSIAGVVRDCTSTENDNGISVGYTSTVSNCSSYLNDGYGFSGSSSSIVESCTSRSNGGDGISVYTGSVVRNCVSNANGTGGFGSGIVGLASDTRIEGNVCVGNPRGIRVEAAGNIIVRNSCSGNQVNWDLAANNLYGPIVDKTAPASPPVSGNSTPGTMGTTDPNANVTY